jgi:hypothetical protein
MTMIYTIIIIIVTRTDEIILIEIGNNGSVKNMMDSSYY